MNARSVALLRRAARAHALHRLVDEARPEIERLKPTAAQLAAELKDILEAIPRGSPQAIANRARLRRIWSDPALRAEFLSLRAAAIEATRQRPRHRGRWLPDPKPTHSELLRRAHARRKNISRASAARFADPTFRAQVANQLAVARAQIGPRRRDTHGHFLPRSQS